MASSLLEEFRKAFASSTLSESLCAELEEVSAQLDAVSQALEYPLREITDAEIRRAFPFARAAVVLSAGVGETDTTTVRQRRIYLAAALEMLQVALGIHEILLDPSSTVPLGDTASESNGSTQNKGLLGTTILAGDYCFSRSAKMAAQTDDPQVVALFAEALKMVSEDHLRGVFQGNTEAGQSNAILFRFGVEAAAHLAALPAQEAQQNIEFSAQLAREMYRPASDVVPELPLASVPPYQRERWQQVAQWLLVDHSAIATD